MIPIIPISAIPVYHDIFDISPHPEIDLRVLFTLDGNE